MRLQQAEATGGQSLVDNKQPMDCDDQLTEPQKCPEMSGECVKGMRDCLGESPGGGIVRVNVRGE